MQTIKTQTHTLRPVTLNDTEKMLELRNSSFVRRNSINQERIPLSDHHKFLENTLKDKNRLLFALDLPDQTIGYIRFDISPEKRHASFSCYVAEHSEKGSGSALLALGLIALLDHSPKLHKIWLEVLRKNTRAIYLYQKFGFLVEGALSEHLWLENLPEDLLIMGVLCSELKRQSIFLEYEHQIQ